MSDRHVMPAEHGWHVEKEHARRPSARTPTQAEAIQRAVEIVANDGGGQVVVHGTDGEVRENRTIAARAARTTRHAASLAAAAAADGARSTAGDTAEEAARTGRALSVDATAAGTRIGEHARSGAQDVAADATSAATRLAGQAEAVLEGREPARGAAREAASIAATAGHHVGGGVGRTGRRIVDELEVARRRARTEIAGADKTRRSLRRGGDRAAVVGEGLGEELGSAGARVDRTVHALTEHAAHPLDMASDAVLHTVGRVQHALNPVRVTGRALGAALSGLVHLVATATTGAGRITRRATRLDARAPEPD